MKTLAEKMLWVIGGIAMCGLLTLLSFVAWIYGEREYPR